MSEPEEHAMGEHAFQAEVGRVLSLVINSLYSNKEIFLRELVSNASDALDKLRFRALTEPALMEGESALVIRIRPDQERGVLVIEDTGVGMTEAELTENLGTVARSGSQAFLEKLESASKKDVSIIGQFGVGFYSAYLVADRVEVISRAAGTGKAWRWASTGKDTFTIDPDAREARGTAVVLHLKEDQKHLLDEWALRDLVRRYSDYIAYPIELVTTKDGEAKTETINKASALWQRPKSEITDEQYDELYRHLTHDFEAPLARTHFRVEGSVDLVGLLWIPREPPFDLDDPRKARGMRLFVKRVLVMEDCDAVLPQWLRFVRGLVDSDDLPLNVSRELLQESTALRTIRKQVTKRAVDLLDEIASERAEDYEKLWAAFGRILKEGLVVDAEWKERLAKLSRWSSTQGEELTSLDGYVGRMKEGQEAIYYVTGDSKAALQGSPYLEALRARGFEVLLMTDAIDVWAAEALAEYGGKKLTSAMRADLELPESADEAKTTDEAKKELEPLVGVARTVLDDRVREVKLSSRLRESPACLVLAKGTMPAHLEKALRQSGKEVPRGKRDLELNPSHPVVARLGRMASRDAADPRVKEWLLVLYDQSLIAEGSPLDDPNAFAKRVTALLTQAVAAT
jgi:molecular chaperone HtpG